MQKYYYSKGGRKQQVRLLTNTRSSSQSTTFIDYLILQIQKGKRKKKKKRLDNNLINLPHILYVFHLVRQRSRNVITVLAKCILDITQSDRKLFITMPKRKVKKKKKNSSKIRNIEQECLDHNIMTTEMLTEIILKNLHITYIISEYKVWLILNHLAWN